MTSSSDRDKCGLSSLLPMSCRGRAEAFARRLHSRLSSLGSEDGNGSADESSWLAANENPIAISQPIRHAAAATAETDMYLDFGGGDMVLESPGSPEDEIPGGAAATTDELERLINRENLKQLAHHHSEDCHCSSKSKKDKPLVNCVSSNNRTMTTTSHDSDSDGPFYDTRENTADTDYKVNNSVRNNCTMVNGLDSISSSSLSSSSSDTDTKGIDLLPDGTNNCTEELYVTSSECTVPLNSFSSISEDVSTLSLKEDDESYQSLDIISGGSGVPELPQNEIIELDGGNTEIDRIHSNSEEDLIVDCSCPVKDESKDKLLNNKFSKDEESTSTRIQSDDYEEEERTPRVRRCSSLKTGKTPPGTPGTPGNKKIVRFADVLGLDLADVRTFLDEIPKIPHSAYNDLMNVDLANDDDHTASRTSNTATKFHGIKVEKVLMPLFQQPGGQPTFLDRVRDNLVCLENALVKDPLTLSITGTVRVRNLDFHKSVHIRYTLDAWHSHADVNGTYVENTCDGFSDKFSFLIYAHTLTIGQRLEFAVRFQCKGCQYWDNNNGVNYCFQCLPPSNNQPYSPITGVDESWGASFYYHGDQEDLVAAKGSPADDAAAASTTAAELTYTAVQDIIANTLNSKKCAPKLQSDKNIFTVFIILIFSFLFLYIQKAIYFMK